MGPGEHSLEITSTVDFNTDQTLVKFTKYTADGRKKAFILILFESDFFEVTEGMCIPRRSTR